MTRKVEERVLNKGADGIDSIVIGPNIMSEIAKAPCKAAGSQGRQFPL